METGKNPGSHILGMPNTHRLPLEEAPEAYETFLNKEDRCIKVVLKPQ
jgi:threonine dehydrogenase-like Zn-dependent dehydrogenase